ncbi:MAG: hypothetical protein EPO08_03575 [Rhodospirillaceae bacterium]|nr:MAG: hypothetical protein EPO08_03575 [Rhodospirillaceae bacterium]
MPRKKTQLSEAERQRRIRQAAEAAGASDDPKSLDQTFKKLTKVNHPANTVPGRQKSTGRGT